MIVYRRIDKSIFRIDTESKVQKKVIVVLNELNFQAEKIKKLEDKVQRLTYQLREANDRYARVKRRGW